MKTFNMTVRNQSCFTLNLTIIATIEKERPERKVKQKSTQNQTI